MKDFFYSFVIMIVSFPLELLLIVVVIWFLFCLFGCKRREKKMKILLLISMALLPLGCASMFSAETIATYTSPDGRSISYKSAKEQQGIDVEFAEGDKVIKIKVDKTGTAESAITAALQLQLELTKLIGQILPLAMQAKMAGS